MNAFAYTIDDEPTEDWKVEHVLQWWLLRANAESEAEYNNTVEGLSKQLKEGKEAIWEAHAQVSEIVRDSENDRENVFQNANVKAGDQSEQSNSLKPVVAVAYKNKGQPTIVKPDPKPMPKVAVATSKRPTRNKKPTAKVTAMNTASAASAPPLNSTPDTIHIDIVGGPYGGLFFDLQPKTRSHAWVGRSSSTKFKDRGISLPLDLEVSTSHGRFEFKQGIFYFTDVASTNGTRIDGKECVPNHPYKLTAKGMTILAGQTPMKVTLLKLA